MRYIAIINLFSTVQKVLNVTRMAFIDRKLNLAVHNYLWVHVIRQSLQNFQMLCVLYMSVQQVAPVCSPSLCLMLKATVLSVSPV